MKMLCSNHSLSIPAKIEGLNFCSAFRKYPLFLKAESISIVKQIGIKSMADHEVKYVMQHVHSDRRERKVIYSFQEKLSLVLVPRELEVAH